MTDPINHAGEPLIAVLAAGQDSRRAYAARLAELGAGCESVPDLASLVALLRQRPLSGVVLDLPSLIKDKSYDKRAVTELTDYFPLLRARITAGGDILALAQIGTAAPGEAFAHFVKVACAAFPARRIRASQRIGLCLNVLAVYAPRDDSGQDAFGAPFKTCALNIGLGGCFIWDVDPPEPGTKVLIVFHDQPGGLSAKARVVWRLPWGERAAAPGAGLEFEELSPQTEALIATLAALPVLPGGGQG